MRIWTALGAWAAMMSAAIALVILGLTLNGNKPESGASLIPLGIGFAVVATAIFAADLLFLLRREVLAWRAQRMPAVEYGVLDYQPELEKAIDAYTKAQGEITAETNRANAVFVEDGKRLNEETDAHKRQALAVQLADAATALSQAMNTNVAIMATNASVIRRCLAGFLLSTRIAKLEDAQALVTFRGVIRTSRGQTTELGDTIKGTRAGVRVVRARNLSWTLNAATRELNGRLNAYRSTLKTVARDFWGAEAMIALKLFLARRHFKP